MSGDINQRLSERLVALRNQHGWSLEQLSEKSGVSRASLSRLEKGEVSATAEMLGKVCTAYSMTLSRLIMMVEDSFHAHVRTEEQAVWLDPGTGFLRRTLSPPSDHLSGEVIECTLPAGAEIGYEAPSIEGLEHHLVMLAGGVTITVDDTAYELSAGDCLRYLLNGPTIFRSDRQSGAKYLVFLTS